jgi:hypothetical protein
LFSILEGDTALDSTWTLTPAAKNELQFFESLLQTAFLTRFDPLKPISLLIVPSPHSPTGILAQENSPLEWLYLKQKETKVLTSCIDLIFSLIIQGKNAYRFWDLIHISFYPSLPNSLKIHYTLMII